MSGGFEPDPDDEEEDEEEEDDAVIAELALNTPVPPASAFSNRNVPIDLSQDSPNSSPTRQSSRIKKNSVLQSNKDLTLIRSPTRSVSVLKDLESQSKPTPSSSLLQSRPISSFKPISIPFVAVPSIRKTSPHLTSPLPSTPTRSRTRAVVGRTNPTPSTELSKTATGTTPNELTNITKTPTKNSKTKRKVYSKEIVLPLLHSLLPHLSGTSPLPIEFPNPDDGEEVIDKKLMLNEIECLVGLEETELELRMVLNRTIVEHEGNVLLLCGGRGSGKTAIVNRTLGLFEDPKMFGLNSFITIRLNGLIQTNDKLALREMSRQLIIALNTEKIENLGLSSEEVVGNREEEELMIVEDGTSFNTYAKTLKNLIYLLEPPSEERSEGAEVSKTLVIVLEEFDRFTLLDRQAFLYTLLDIVQGNKRRGGICVIGTTAVVDCLDRLEKRVKSRCQSRIQYLFSPKTLIERKELIKSLLSLKHNQVEKIKTDDEENQKMIKSFVQQWNEELEGCLEFNDLKVWLENLFGLVSDGVPKVLQELNQLISTISYNLTNDETIEFPILSHSSPFKPSTIPTKKTNNSIKKPKPIVWWMEWNLLSSIELTILIASKHLSSVYESRMFNLEMCWDSYRKHLKRMVLNEDEIGTGGIGGIGGSGFGDDRKKLVGVGVGRSQVYGRDAFEMGWERLMKLEILLPIKPLNESKLSNSNHENHQNGLIGSRFDYVRLKGFGFTFEEVV
ncbi:uncharacterized protein MELLADRAFT_86485 [Melampsora larici-populina 98AG31]|uniref:Origin recognition complex subunit 4 C-terminal domain-containing protein n=1 Tax=Melampsora larici-populina (strain 98AG31 / pathotype 3-4-7) TaxID=747676 RepID=F4RM02_MELLP|nr:uncharacterized protein MELLADRAFT_86485 [Melampsora larici-populina 98AG31]EGG06638.1 hypothetical protein MELLADRAFT_86485 [Melampsora larici-populina 98AG31]